ncbi:Regulation of nuclear pre-mRNA domain-containing protein 2 [Eumeta japonica]|uniref:Regulation of nuclear pre-mRNA domain-containing protein 2 n=1 Tax=Eumeta variegata TaxID=151549 RepID=A0A4C1VVS4_EUMVA|nr:Regulation of nuclear pre-mRNA domain-containing protein 2 [Eumeta japonica]
MAASRSPFVTIRRNACACHSRRLGPHLTVVFSTPYALVDCSTSLNLLESIFNSSNRDSQWENRWEGQRDEKVRHKILRIFKIWEQRSVYDEEFLSDLTGLLSAGAIKKSADDDSIDFQPQQLVNKIRQCAVLETETDLRLKFIHESHLELSDADALCASLKDRRNKDDVEKELNEGAACVERYTEALQKEIVVREQLLELLNSASQYYSTQRGEVKVVAYAYKTFGARVRALKRKLDDLIPQLPNAAPSPPERDEDVPSPGPEEDLDLPPAGDNSEEEGLPKLCVATPQGVVPGASHVDVTELISYNIDKTFNTSLTADGSLYNLGLSSFLGTENPLLLFNETNSQGSTDNTGKKIEVINNRPSEKQDFNINEFLKNLMPVNDTNTSDNNSVLSVALSQKSQEALPGLDLLVSENSSNPPPPTSFYGSINSTVQDEAEHYGETNNQWTNPPWNLPPLVSPSLAVPTMVPPVAPSLSSAHKSTPNLAPINSTLSSITKTHTPITPTRPPITPTHTPLTTTHPPLAPAHAPITPARVTIAPAHAAITPAHAPLTPTLASITPVHSTISLETPESPPPASAPLAPPPVVPSTRMFARDLPPSDVDHRGLLPPPPPPPPPLLPSLGVLEDIDHRLLPSLNAPAVTSTPLRNAAAHKDVDHRNLIPLTHQMSEQSQLLRGTDQVIINYFINSTYRQ